MIDEDLRMKLTLAFDEFNKELEDLKQYIQVNIIEYQDKISEFHQVELIDTKAIEMQDFFRGKYRKTRTLAKIINYSAVIILLYAYFEKFLENTARYYLEDLCKCCETYDRLPEKIQKNHLEKSIDLIKNINLDKYRSLTEQEILENLYHCQCENKNTINFYAYMQHRGNFRSSTILDFFADIGINNINGKIANLDDFKTYIKVKTPELGIFLESKNKDFNHLYSRINDLVSKRNDIAHGMPTSQILSFEIIIDDYIDFIQNYSKSLQEVLYNQVLFYEIKYCLLSLGKPIKVWNNEIIGIEVHNIKISVGDRIIGKKADGNCKSGTIISIQVNGESKNSIEVEDDSVQVGLKVNFFIKENYEIFISQIKS